MDPRDELARRINRAYQMTFLARATAASDRRFDGYEHDLFEIELALARLHETIWTRKHHRGLLDSGSITSSVYRKSDVRPEV